MNVRGILTRHPYWLPVVATTTMLVCAVATWTDIPTIRMKVALIAFECMVIFAISRLLQRTINLWRSSEGKFGRLFESDVLGLAVTDARSGRILEANCCYLNMLGLTKEDLKKRKVTWTQFTPPEHLAASRDAIHQLNERGAAPPFEKEYVRPDGQRVWAQVGATKVGDVMVAYILDISDRKRTEKELAETKSRLEENVVARTQELLQANRELSETQKFLDSVIDNIPNMIFVKDAKTLKFKEFNRAGERLVGHDRADLIGKNDFDFFPREQAEFFTAKDREVLAGHTLVDIPEEPIQTWCGRRFLHTRKIPILDETGIPLYLLGISEDITEKKVAESQRLELIQAQAARQAAELNSRRLEFLSKASAALNKSLDIRELLESFGKVVVADMADWCVVDLYNPRQGSIKRLVAADKLDNMPEEVRDWWKLKKFDFNAREGIGRVIRTGKSRIYNNLDHQRFLKLFHDPDLASRAAEWGIHSALIVPLSYHGNVLGTLSLVQSRSRKNYDAQDLTIVEDLAKRVALAVENARLYAKAAEASRAKSAFLANVSHEIRTPLGAMLGFAELAMDDRDLSERQRTYIATIARNGRQLLCLVDEILDLSKVESDRIQIEKLAFSLPGVLTEVRDLMRVKADEKGLRLRMGAVSCLPERVKSDPLRVRQILFNVIGNAIKFTERGEIAVRSQFKPDFQTETRGVLEIAVEDSGIGMDEVQQKRIFQPFVQADGTMTRKYGGTGLGLVLARKMARLLGGDVVLSRTCPGQGSEFLVALPLELDPHPVTTDARSTVAHPHMHQNLEAQILLVDDSADNRMLISAFLALPGIHLDLAENGRLGVEKAMGRAYDLILMDIQMPEMDGYEAIATLLKRGYKGPIVALTAHGMKGDREQCLKAGFADYLCKPITRQDLLGVIKRFSSGTAAASCLN